MNKRQRTVPLILLLVFLCGLIPKGMAADTKEEELFLVAQKAFEDGFYDVAIRYISQFLEDYPQTNRRVQARLLLGQCYFFKKQYLKAYDIFQKLLDTHELKDATLFWMGETYFKGADYQQAREYYQKLLDIYPDSAYRSQAHYSLAWTYFEEGDYAQAKDIFSEFIKENPQDALSEDALFKLAECEYHLGYADMASQYFRNYILKYPKSPRHAKAYFYIAESHYYIEDYPAAITYYAKVANIAYDQKLVLMATISMAWSYLKLDKYELAQQYFDQALRLSQEYKIPSDDIYLGRATLYAKMEQNEKARDAYATMIGQFPTSPRIDEAHLGKANMDYKLGNYTQALQNYQWIIDRYGDQPQYRGSVEKAYYGLAWTYLKEGDVERAVGHFKNILNQTNSDVVKVSVLTQIGDAYQDSGDLNQALEYYDQVLKNHPDSLYSDYVQFREGIALLKLNKLEAATLAFQSLQANFPGSKYINDTRYYLGLANFKKKSWNQTIHYLNEYLVGLPHKPDLVDESRYLIALSHFYLESFERAVKLFQEIIHAPQFSGSFVPSARFYLAKSLFQLGQTKEALKAFKLIPELHAQDDIAQDALIWLGDYYLKKSDFANAVIYYETFLQDYPGSDSVPFVQYEIGQAFQVQGEYDQALDYYRRIPQDNREIYAKAQLAIAEIFSEQTDDQTALQAYQKIITAVPDFQRDAYMQIARIHEKNKKYRSALQAYQSALDSQQALSDIKNAELLFHIGDTFELLNEDAQAVDHYLKIPYLHPRETTWVIKSYLRVARIFEDKSQWDDAQNIYNKILAYETEEAKYARERLDWIRENTFQ